MTIALPVDLLPETILVYVLVFSRIGAAMMVLPALGEMNVSPRIRLVMAIMVAAVLAPVVASSYPAMPLGIGSIASSLIAEIVVGLFIGLTARMFMSALQVAGTVIAFQTGLAFAMNMDPTQGVQGAIVGTYLAVLGTAMIFVTDLHHLMLIGLRDSYTLFPPSAAFPTSDFLAVAVDTVASAFTLGLQLAAPFLVFSLIFYLGIGVLSKLIPQVQIFFIAMPANILFGFVLLFLLLGSIMLYFLEHFEALLMRFIV
ncbi:flagellar biosynthetic protein FliR [Pyruvatibacter sp.]|uniref:flagellar biosynthetic protein FliR n=1 Tax=Pyruvatibacter sp. TaxID=1981328 RepID=UPI0032F072F0